MVDQVGYPNTQRATTGQKWLSCLVLQASRRYRSAVTLLAAAILLALVATALSALPSAAAVLPTTWASPASPIFTGDTQEPAFAYSSDGSKATALWKAGNGTCNNILTASATVEGNVANWGTPVTLTDCVSGRDTEKPAISLSADGIKAVAAWDYQFPGGLTTRVETKSATITGNQGDWTDGSVAPTIIQDVGGITAAPRVAVSGDGTRAVLAWASDVGGSLVPPRASSIATMAATINGSDALWESTLHYVSGDGSEGIETDFDVALSSDGQTAITTFIQRITGSNSLVYAAIGDIDAGPSPSDPPSSSWGSEVQIAGIGGTSPNSPSVAMSSDGTKATCIWGISGGGQRSNLAASATIGSKTSAWGATKTLTTSTLNGSAPQVGLSSDGSRATAVWAWNTGGFPQPANPVVQSSSGVIAGNQGDWSTEQTITASGTYGQNPDVGVSSDGTQATVVWGGFAVSTMSAASGNITGKVAEWSAPTTIGSTSTTYIALLGVSSDGSRATAIFVGDGNGSLLSASAIRTYTIGFRGNGGTGSMSNLTGNSPTTLPANQFVRSRHTFIGWNTKANGTGTRYRNQGTYQFRAGGLLYAQWRGMRVTFAANGGSGVMPAQEAGKPTKLHANTFVRKGYVFAGWNTKADGSGTHYANEAVYPFTADARLHARWQGIQYAVNHCPQDQLLPAIPRRGFRLLTKAGCVTNLNATIGTFMGFRRARGDVVVPTDQPRLLCLVGKQFTAPKPTGYGKGWLYCPVGPMLVQTRGRQSQIFVRWYAPRTPTFAPFSTEQTFLT